MTTERENEDGRRIRVCIMGRGCVAVSYLPLFSAFSAFLSVVLSVNLTYFGVLHVGISPSPYGVVDQRE